MDLVILNKSVGRRGINLAPDVVTIGAALTAIGPERGGIYGPPLSIEGLAQAIEQFQKFQKLPVADGRVDPNGNTHRRINEVLNPGLQPPAPKPGGSGKVRRLVPQGGMKTAIDTGVYVPDEASLRSEMVFKWTAAGGKGDIQYFELDEDVVPNWFGVVVPQGVTTTQDAHIFFHPTPGQAGYKDANYSTKTGWSGVFHYMSDAMSVQFCAAGTGQVLIMPLMTQGAAATCGVFPERWESIVGEILGLVAAGSTAETASPLAVSTVVVSSFSSGITYSAAFRARAKLGTRLRGVVDFDGMFSTYRQYSQALVSPAAHPVVRIQQMTAAERALPDLARKDIFPLPVPRWGRPWAMIKTPLQVHAVIPQTMMHVAANRTRPR